MNDVLGLVLLAAGTLGVAAFIILYSIRTPWWRSETGWWLVTGHGALGLLLANGVVFRIFGDYPGRQIVNLLLFVVVVAGTWWCFALLYRAPRNGKG